MKICHLIFTFNTGGAETMLVDILNEQVKYCEVNLIVVNDSLNEELLNKINNNIKIYKINRKLSSRNILYIIKLNYLLISLKFDIIHCHNYNLRPLIFPIIFSKIMLTVHTLGVPTTYHGKYHKIFAISNSVQEDIKKRSNIDSIVVYNGIRTNDILVKENYSFDKFKILQISRLDHNKKGQHILIEALKILLLERRIKNIELDFIGEGDSLDFLNKLANSLGLENCVNFLGLKSRDYIYSNIKNYELLVQPSLYEGFGLTIVEAMAAKVPVLVSDIDGPMEVINNGNYGYYFKSNDTKDCADKLQMIINNAATREHKNKIENAYIYVNENFDVKITAINYLNYYKHIN